MRSQIGMTLSKTHAIKFEENRNVFNNFAWFFFSFLFSLFFTWNTAVQGCKPDAVFFFPLVWWWNVGQHLFLRSPARLSYSTKMKPMLAFFQETFFCNSDVNLFNWRPIIWVSLELKLKFWFLFFIRFKKNCFLFWSKEP